MKEKPLYEGDERVFTLEDVRALFLALRKKLVRAALVGAVLFFSFFWCKPVQYRAEATFKEEAEKKDSEGVLQNLLGGSVGGGKPQAAVLMKCSDVLKPLIERLGLNAQVVRGGIVSKVYRRLRDSLLAEMDKPLPDLDPFVFRNVVNDGEESHSFTIEFDDPTHFSVLDGSKKLLAPGVLGQEVRLDGVKFTLISPARSVQLGRCYSLVIVPWRTIAQSLGSQIQISTGKANQSIYSLSLLHRNRQLGTEILNELMVEYQNYLKRDHDRVSMEQLAYLDTRQNQIFRKLDAIFSEQTTYFAKSLEESGLMGLAKDVQVVLTPLQQMMSKVSAIDVELGCLSLWEKEERLITLNNESPLSIRLAEISSSLGELQQQKDLIELSLQQSREVAQNQFWAKQEELRDVRLQRDEAQGLLAAIGGKGTIPKRGLFDPEGALSVWAEALKSDRERDDFASYLGHRIRLLAVQENMLQERLCYGSSPPAEYKGIDLSTAQQMLIGYHSKLDTSEGMMRRYSQLQEEIDRAGFELSSLSVVLQDPLSQELIASACQIGLQLKDDQHRTEREAERWRADLSLQKEILKEHLKQLYKVEQLNTELIREKMVGLRQASLDGAHQQMSILKEEAKTAIKERQESLSLEKELLTQKIQETSHKISAALPEKWRSEKWLDLRSQMEIAVMETLTQLVESKTITHHLHRIHSRPLELAVVPSEPQKPRLVMMACMGGCASGMGLFLALLVGQILSGFPSSTAKLRAMRYPLLGELHATLDGPECGDVSGPDLELLRQIGLFLEVDTHKKRTAALFVGKGPDYSYALAQNLARRQVRSVVVRCDFLSPFRESDIPGVLQMWKGEAPEAPIRRRDGYDLIPAGGYSPYGLEILQSTPFQKLMEELKRKYDVVFLLFRSNLESAESLAALQLCDRAIVSVCGEQTEKLTPFVDWAYHENGEIRLKFVVST